MKNYIFSSAEAVNDADYNIVELADIPPICRDPEDDKLIATALAGSVDYLVTADGDLRTPEIKTALQAAGVAIISVDELIALLG